jgi:hypothetical protein
MSYNHGCHLASQFLEDYKVILIIAGLASYTQFGFTIRIKPTAWKEFLGGSGTGRCKVPS